MKKYKSKWPTLSILSKWSHSELHLYTREMLGCIVSLKIINKEILKDLEELSIHLRQKLQRKKKNKKFGSIYCMVAKGHSIEE
jgi:hypothetical protein